MSVSVPKRFVRTPENILVALGFPPKREHKAKLKYWRTFKDFPKKERNGFDVEKLLEFMRRHEQEFASTAALAKRVTAQPVPKSTGSITFPDSTQPDDAVEGEPEVMGYAGVAELLSRHFRVPVSKMDISDWCHGKRLDHGVPNFPPPKASGRFNKLETINWFREHKYHDPRSTFTPDLFKRLENERAQGELERLEHERLMRAVEKNKYLLISEAKNLLAAVIAHGRDKLWDLFDHEAYRKHEENLSAKGMPEEWRIMALTDLRELNPYLLQKYHVAMTQKGVVVEKELEGEKEHEPVDG